MKFLIQKIDGRIQHDFSFTLLKSIEYMQWVRNDPKAVKVKYYHCEYNGDFGFKPFHVNYVPVGSVEFVSAWFNQFYGVKPKPINVPEELFGFSHRKIENVTNMELGRYVGDYYIKSNDKIKGYQEMIKLIPDMIPYDIPIGQYQISTLTDIDSEWRCFVYMGDLVGMQHYSGDFKMFPCIEDIMLMIKAYKSAPNAYTLDIGIHDENNFVIECHDFFSCGLYGFADHRVLPYMFYRWHQQYLRKIKKYEIL